MLLVTQQIYLMNICCLLMGRIALFCRVCSGLICDLKVSKNIADQCWMCTSIRQKYRILRTLYENKILVGGAKLYFLIILVSTTKYVF